MCQVKKKFVRYIGKLKKYINAMLTILRIKQVLFLYLKCLNQFKKINKENKGGINMVKKEKIRIITNKVKEFYKLCTKYPIDFRFTYQIFDLDI